MRPDRTRQRRRRWWVPPVVAATVLLAVSAWGIHAHPAVRLPEAGAAPVLGPGSPVMTPVTVRTGTRTGAPRRPSPGPAVPMPAVLPVGAESVRIPSLHVTATARPESLDRAGALGVPGDPAEVGWWMPTTAELVIDGHVDLAGVGPGALFEVRALRPGAAVVVATASGPEHWRIDGVRAYRKGHVPAGLFRGLRARLVIITCGGPFDYATRHYYDNVVAYASPAPR